MRLHLLTLSEILPAAHLSGVLPPGLEVGQVTADSRAVAQGDVFVATRGVARDGHAFIPAAIGAGAAVIVAETPPSEGFGGLWCQVPDGAAALARLAAACFDHPARAVRLLATTGTNGKTTTSFLLRDILTHAGHKTGLISTIRVETGAEVTPTLFTTPPAPELQRILAEMRDHGCAFAAIEASSHGLAQRRIDALEVAVAGFTNLSRDHLDYHGTMAAYAEAKARLFTELAQAAVFNVDDPVGAELAEAFVASGREVLTLSCEPDHPGADLRIEEPRVDLTGCGATLRTPEGDRLPLWCGLVGAHNLQNALLALGMARLAGLDWEVATAGLAAAGPVPGRLERVSVEDPAEPAIFVDYAHTPDALDRVLGTLGACRPIDSKARLICVFGAGGDRDRGKRPEMAAAVASRADLAIVTSDNPRTEDPARILEDVAAGLPAGFPHRLVADRGEAIRSAIMDAQPGDLIVIAGKGHEDYQIVGTTRLPFDDRQVAREALQARCLRSAGGQP